MDASLIVFNLLNPPVLFFFLGLLAVTLKSDLEIPSPLPKFFSLYLLMAIGFRGGVELSHGGLNRRMALLLLAAVLMALLVPLYSFFVLKRRMPLPDAAAIAATYGSVSAVTFITATSFLQRLGIEYGGHLVAAMALMESPAIIVGVLLFRWFAKDNGNGDFSWRELFRDAFLNGSVFLIMGSFAIGALTGDTGWKAMRPFADDIFKGILAFFLLDMGLVAARRLGDLRRAGGFLTAFALLVPITNALIGILLSYLIGLPKGDALMLTVLCASASYIAVPAAMRLAIPEANPSLYVPMALAITFPFNIIAGLPFYLYLINILWS